MIKSFKNREFKFWDYHISHSELLIRSTKNNDNAKNIDIMFFDVIYVELPRYIPELKIEEANNEDLLYIKEKVNKPVKLENITILSSNEKRYLVVASIVKIEENELDMFELPFTKTD